MYKIYADDTLIYDSTIDDYKIGKGSVSLETNKSGSFTFSVYPDHFFYDSFVKLKTVITVYKSNKIIFRGRILNDVTDYWNNKVITCEGELGFLQDSIIRPFAFNGTPEDLFKKFVEEHNSQVDVFKRFKIGKITVLDPNNYIARSNSAYESALSNMNSRLIEDSLGGYIHITHGEDGADPTPTLNYLADFTKVSTQLIEFGSNLKNYTKTVKGEEIATAIIPLGAEVDDGNDNTENPKLTIADINNGVDYVYDETAVAVYGWIFKVIEWEDVTEADNLKRKAEAYLADVVKQNITIELNAIDLHLLDHSIESFKVGDYVRVVSEPHNFADTLLCQKQTIDLLKPENDTITLGHTYRSFTATTAEAVKKAESISDIRSSVTQVKNNVNNLNYKTNQYKIAEQQLAALMSRSFGVFNTEEVLEDGSTIFYMHDEPKLENSKNIWKMTGDAFSVSNDGGKTWRAGIDASGNAILNILSVIGIDATWINADNLAAISANLGGWTLKNNMIKSTYVDPTDGATYDIEIRPPSTTAGATLRNFIEMFVSDEAGAGQRVRLSDKEFCITYPDGEGTKYTSLEGSKLTLINTNTQIKCIISNTGIEFYAPHPELDSYTRMVYLMRQNDGYWKLFVNGDVSCGAISCSDVSAGGYVGGYTVEAKGALKVNGSNGLTGNVQFGNYVMQFACGVLINTYYV